MSYDFRTNQIATHQIIASGSTGTEAGLLVYSASADGTPPLEGNINPAVFNTGSIGSDIFLYISGATPSINIANSHGASVFGGDVVVSGVLKTIGGTDPPCPFVSSESFAYTTCSVAFNAGATYTEALGGDVRYYFDGSPNSFTNGDREITVFRGDIRSSGSVIFGGSTQTVINIPTYTSILGGRQHQIDTGTDSAIVAGRTNKIYQGIGNIIGAGQLNRVTGSYNGIVAGSTNLILDSSDQSFIGGGEANQISGGYGNSVAAGNTNKIQNSSMFSIIGAGSENFISAALAGVEIANAGIVAGYQNSITSETDYCDYTVIGAGTYNIISSSNLAGILAGYTNYISGGVGSGIVVGYTNQIFDSSQYSIIGAGSTNTITGSSCAAIGAGIRNKIDDSSYCGIYTGADNILESGSVNSSIVGGTLNKITAEDGALIPGTNSAILSGRENIISGSYNSVIDSGWNNIIEATSEGFIGTGTSHKILDSTTSCIVVGTTHMIESGSLECGILAGGYSKITEEISTPIGCYDTVILGGSYHVISGSSNSAIVAGYSNTMEFTDYAIIGAGVGNNIASSSLASIIGAGGYNTVETGSISCGIFVGSYNKIIKDYDADLISNRSAILSGLFNLISGSVCSAILTGDSNTSIDSDKSVMLGGSSNTITSSLSCEIGGVSNIINASTGSVILEGLTNVMSATIYSAIVAGENSIIENSARSCGILAGNTNKITEDASYNPSVDSAILAGFTNTISGSEYAAILGGTSNTIDSSNLCLIGAGSGNNIANSLTSCGIFAGEVQLIESSSSECGIFVGSTNKITEETGTSAPSERSAILAGYSNTISGSTRSVILGGTDNTLDFSNESFLIGSGLKPAAGTNNIIVIGGDASTGYDYRVDVSASQGLFVSGVATFDHGLSGSLQCLTDGTPYIVAGTNITVNTASNGSIEISSSGGSSWTDKGNITYTTASVEISGALYTTPQHYVPSGTSYEPMFVSSDRFDIPYSPGNIINIRTHRPYDYQLYSAQIYSYVTGTTAGDFALYVHKGGTPPGGGTNMLSGSLSGSTFVNWYNMSGSMLNNTMYQISLTGSIFALTCSAYEQITMQVSAASDLADLEGMYLMLNYIRSGAV